MDPINPIAGNPEALNQSQKPTEAKSSSNITVISMALFVLMSLVIVGFLYYQNQQLKSMLASYQNPSPSPVPTATADPTTNWQTYTDDLLKFSFKYPQQVTVSPVVKENGSGMTYVLSSGEDITVLTKYSSSQVNSFMNTASTGNIQVGQASWKIFYVPTGYPEPQVGAGNPIYALQTEMNKKLVTFILNNQSDITDEQKQILSTFKFAQATPSALPSNIPVPVSTSSAIPNIIY